MADPPGPVPASPPPPSAPAPAEDAAALPAGYLIHEYQIRHPLGGGGFGITYLAQDGNLHLPVAIKEYFPAGLVTRGIDGALQVRGGNDEHLAQFDWGLERFLEEARALASFRHPNIVRVMRYFRENGTAYIVMEYESGLPLKRWVPHNGPLSRDGVLSIVHPVLDGLEAVHSTGFLHRDIKPDNIYVRADGTPVLLDFGAARRLSAERDVTNIVSPGYAAFEQYHSQGHQGPWTDIYSLGAVMYWMVTGRRPVESVARVHNDTLPPAASLADAGVYGAALLDAIAWAMQPQESRRPQTVALLRAAIGGAGKAVRAAAAPQSGPALAMVAPPERSVSGPPATAGAGVVRRKLLCTIMFVNLPGQEARAAGEQAEGKALFDELLATALQGVPDESRIVSNAAAGAAVCFMGDPEEALHCALLLRDLLAKVEAGKLPSARIGLHLGPVQLVSGLGDRVNVVGDGINVAQRIMEFAQPDQVLVSRPYYDVISRITEDTAGLLHYLGQYGDMHGRLHDVYAVDRERSSATRREGPATGYSRTVPVASGKALAAQELQEVELELARNIGPLARILVRKAAPLAASIQALRDALAPTIEEPRARAAFIAGSAGPSQGSHPVSAARASTSQGLGHSARPGPPALHPDIAPDEMAVIEHTLSKFMGPMAAVLIRKQSGRTRTFREFVEAIAADINPPQRELFLLALRRALLRRQG